jgi:hypothetical protein
VYEGRYDQRLQSIWEAARVIAGGAG